MLTIRNILRFHLCKVSDRIKQLKEECKVPVTIKRRTFLTGLALDAESNKMTLLHISPRHPRWVEYVGLKLHVSHLLTAMHLQVWMEKKGLTTKDAAIHNTIIQFIYDGLCEHHCNKKKVTATAKGALTLLDQHLVEIESDVNNIADWVAEQAVQAESRKASQGVDGWMKEQNPPLDADLVHEQLGALPRKAVS